MVKTQLNSITRLVVGGVWSVALLLVMMRPVSFSRSDIPLYLVQGGLSAVAIVALMPILIRGDWVQRTLAVLVLLLPAIGLISAFFLVTGLL